jgi:CRISPR-associated endonuclease/helicase Cas3
VNYKISFDNWSWDQIANQVLSASQSLTIVNTTQLAQLGFESLKKIVADTCFHLSARMVPAHREKVLKEILHRLDPKNPMPCHVISTQVVEAGIDLDFPLVLRQMAPLDSIIQAAGRCNRENGVFWESAIVQIFELVDANYPSSDYQSRTSITREILKSYDLNDEILEATALYYQKSYSALSGDRHKIQELRRELKFEKVSEEFKIIDDSYQFSAFVPWGAGAELIKPLNLSKNISEEVWRSLQPYTINLPKKFQSIAMEHPCGLVEWPISFYSENFGATELMQSSII